MGLFNHDTELRSQYKNVATSTIKELNEEFLAGFQYGTQEYSGSWEEKNWKDDLEKFAKELVKYDRITFLSDAKNIGISIGKIHGMLSSHLAYMIFNDDKSSGIIIEIIHSLNAMKSFNLKDIKKRIEKLNKKQLTEQGITNHGKVLKVFLMKDM